jgi:hypothetical protein
MVGFKNEPHKFLHQELGTWVLQIAIAKPFLAFPVEMVLVPIMLGGNLVLHDNINLMSSWCELQIMLLAAKHKFDYF